MTRQFSEVLVPWFMFGVLFASVYFSPFISGWRKLAARYRTIRSFEGETRTPWIAYMNWGSKYGGALKMGLGSEGLYLRSGLLFRINHPDLLVPWDDVYIRRKKAFIGWDMVQLNFKDCEGVHLEITEAFARKIGLDLFIGHPFPE